MVKTTYSTHYSTTRAKLYLAFELGNQEWKLGFSVGLGGREYLRLAPHITSIPGLAIFTLVIGFNFLGDGLRDLLDPHLR